MAIINRNKIIIGKDVKKLKPFWWEYKMVQLEWKRVTLKKIINRITL